MDIYVDVRCESEDCMVPDCGVSFGNQETVLYFVSSKTQLRLEVKQNTQRVVKTSDNITVAIWMVEEE